jgi:hypothetical protein
MDWPWQAGLEDASMLTLTGKLLLTFITMALDVAGLPVGQEILELRILSTVSPLFGI